MRNLREEIIAASEHAFDRHGFTATGMDALTQAAEVSTRTLYKYVGNKNALIAAVLESRSEKFFNSISATTVDGLFEDLDRWIQLEGARGCLFFRAQGEGAATVPEVADVISSYRRKLRELIDRLVRAEISRQDPTLVGQVLVLFEGAVTAASYLGEEAVSAGRAAAKTLMERAR
ncbi:TetR/AcrR family transcriptional regulator [Arthrobacter sp. QXT-31]|uniref:TetR/AcrR family transcriptional regulator n=1 Tax=Arthrobacter sp. QXT-31 TaxID=1357915 RepID=UPI00097176EA|nr:TetR/AcrR family transcriptional regulator [Arthrobacter sp. QXT-31]APX02867.1 TetR family transcriptional regulator [Arthrobacter sp. QXT-31]